MNFKKNISLKSNSRSCRYGSFNTI